ncbi:hypothetical protein [Haliangium sp.]|uniref:hypothetical protein n=1 Tax=Haliangium sp. TaxID=2663208 RepID=UPI003D12369E
MRLTITFFTCALVWAATAAPASAERFELGMGSVSRWMPSGSVLSLHDGSSTGLGLDAAVQVGAVAGLSLAVDGSYATDAVSGRTFQRMDTETRTHALLVGVRAQRAVAPLTEAYGRVAAGAIRVAATLDDDYAAESVSDHGWGAALYAGAGVEVLPIRRVGAGGRGRFALGVRAELGYLAMTPVALTGRSPDADMPAGAIEIPAHAASLGRLNMSALTLGLSAVARF